MNQTAILFTSVASFGLMSIVYLFNTYSRPGSWMRGEQVTAILLALLTGAFTFAVSMVVLEVVQLLIGKLTPAAFFSNWADLVSIGGVVLTMALYWSLVRSGSAEIVTPNNVTPLTPRPVSTGPVSSPMKKAA